jgi:hypothetical protein
MSKRAKTTLRRSSVTNAIHFLRLAMSILFILCAFDSVAADSQDSQAEVVEIKDIGRNPKKAYVIISYPSSKEGLMRVQLSKRIDYVFGKRNQLGGSGFRYDVIFDQLFDTKIVIETDPGRYEIWVGQASSNRGVKTKRFNLSPGDKYIHSWSYK